MEYAKPKKIMQEFAEPILVRLLKKFMPEVYPPQTEREGADDGIPASLSQKVLEDHYYSFAHRRVYAKLRRMGYFVAEAERLYRQLIHDELRYYKLYDFSEFEESNPVVSEVAPVEEVTEAAEENKDSAIEEVKIEPSAAETDDKPKEEVKDLGAVIA